MKRVLISGGAGFIGSRLSKRLIKKGYKITILDNLSEQIHGSSRSSYKALSRITNFIKGDVCNKEDWKKAIKNQDTIIHLAAETGTGQSMYEIDRYNQVNIVGTSNLFEVLSDSEHTIQKMVLSSSRAVYGEGKYKCKNHGDTYPNQRNADDMDSGIFNPKCCNEELEICPISETADINPISIYGMTKYRQEEIFMQGGHDLKIPIVALRYQNVYGPGQSLSNPYTGILSIFSTRILNNNNIEIYEDGKQSRDFVYIEDVVNATIHALENDNANNEIFNVGSGKSLSIFDVANILKDLYDTNIDIIVDGKYRIGDIRHVFCDIRKIKLQLDFEPKINFSEGIREFVDWVKRFLRWQSATM